MNKKIERSIEKLKERRARRRARRRIRIPQRRARGRIRIPQRVGRRALSRTRSQRKKKRTRIPIPQRKVGVGFSYLDAGRRALSLAHVILEQKNSSTDQSETRPIHRVIQREFPHAIPRKMPTTKKKKIRFTREKKSVSSVTDSNESLSSLSNISISSGESNPSHISISSGESNPSHISISSGPESNSSLISISSGDSNPSHISISSGESNPSYISISSGPESSCESNFSSLSNGNLDEVSAYYDRESKKNAIKKSKRKEGSIKGGQGGPKNIPRIDLPKCSYCGKKSKGRCMGCRVAYYCSYECQANDWNRHKKICEMDLEEEEEGEEEKDEEKEKELTEFEIIKREIECMKDGKKKRIRMHEGVAQGIIKLQFPDAPLCFHKTKMVVKVSKKNYRIHGWFWCCSKSRKNQCGRNVNIRDSDIRILPFNAKSKKLKQKKKKKKKIFEKQLDSKSVLNVVSKKKKLKNVINLVSSTERVIQQEKKYGIKQHGLVNVLIKRFSSNTSKERPYKVTKESLFLFNIEELFEGEGTLKDKLGDLINDGMGVCIGSPTVRVIKCKCLINDFGEELHLFIEEEKRRKFKDKKEKIVYSIKEGMITFFVRIHRSNLKCDENIFRIRFSLGHRVGVLYYSLSQTKNGDFLAYKIPPHGNYKGVDKKKVEFEGGKDSDLKNRIKKMVVNGRLPNEIFKEINGKLNIFEDNGTGFIDNIDQVRYIRKKVKTEKKEESKSIEEQIKDDLMYLRQQLLRPFDDKIVHDVRLTTSGYIITCWHKGTMEIFVKIYKGKNIRAVCCDETFYVDGKEGGIGYKGFCIYGRNKFIRTPDNKEPGILALVQLMFNTNAYGVAQTFLIVSSQLVRNKISKTGLEEVPYWTIDLDSKLEKGIKAISKIFKKNSEENNIIVYAGRHVKETIERNIDKFIKDKQMVNEQKMLVMRDLFNKRNNILSEEITYFRTEYEKVKVSHGKRFSQYFYKNFIKNNKIIGCLKSERRKVGIDDNMMANEDYYEALNGHMKSHINSQPEKGIKGVIRGLESFFLAQYSDHTLAMIGRGRYTVVDDVYKIDKKEWYEAEKKQRKKLLQNAMNTMFEKDNKFELDKFLKILRSFGLHENVVNEVLLKEMVIKAMNLCYKENAIIVRSKYRVIVVTTTQSFFPMGLKLNRITR